MHCLEWEANNLVIKSNSLAPLLYTERLKTDWNTRVVTSWNVNTLISRQDLLSSIKYADDVTILVRRAWLSSSEPSRQSYVHQLTSSLENNRRVGLLLNWTIEEFRWVSFSLDELVASSTMMKVQHKTEDPTSSLLSSPDLVNSWLVPAGNRKLQSQMTDSDYVWILLSFHTYKATANRRLHLKWSCLDLDLD